MNEAPNIITPKDLLYIEDMMNWNLVMNKKINTLLDYVSDSEVIDIMCKTKKMHLKHFENLLETLE